MADILVKIQAGHHWKWYRERNGCKMHDNCFTCPYPDCITETPLYHSILAKRQPRDPITKKIIKATLSTH